MATRAAATAQSEDDDATGTPSCTELSRASQQTRPEKKGHTKKKGAAQTETHPCFHCQSEGAKMCCSQCHRTWYCHRACQKRHWNLHKRACVAAVAAEARRATLRRKATAARGDGGIDKAMCVICVGAVVAPVELPCGHAYCGGCLSELRTKKVAQACPLCRAELPPGLDGLHDLAFRAYKRVRGMVDRGEVTWVSLPPSEQEEMDEAVAMLTEAGDQGHVLAMVSLGFLLDNMREDVDSAEATYRAAIAADPRCAPAQLSLGWLLDRKRKDVDGAEAAYRAALAADPGYADAHFLLGNLLMAAHGDVYGAKVEYSAELANHPSNALARASLMFVDALLAEHRGEELAAVADMYDKAAGALTKELGAESKPTEVARARAAAARAGSAARG